MIFLNIFFHKKIFFSIFSCQYKYGRVFDHTKLILIYDKFSPISLNFSFDAFFAVVYISYFVFVWKIFNWRLFLYYFGRLFSR